MRKKIPFIIIAFGFFLNIYSLFLHFKINFLSPDIEVNIPTLVWSISFIFLIYSGLFFKTPHEKKSRMKMLEKIILISFLLIAFFLRLYKISFNPLFLDEWYWVTNAKGILLGLIRTPFGFIGDQPSNLPAYLGALVLFFTKNSYLTARLPEIIFSLLNIFFVFMFVKEAFGKKAAFASSFLLTFSIWDIHMSKLGWNNVNINPFLISGFIFFIYRTFKFKSKKDAVWAGIFLGMSINLLYIAMLDLLVVTIFSFVEIAKNKGKDFFILLGILSLSFFITMSPTIAKVIKHPKSSMGRHGEFINKNLDMATGENKSVGKYYIEQVKLAINDFAYQKNKFDVLILWGITLEPITIFFLLVGLFYSILNFYKPEYLLVLLNFMVMFIPVVILFRTTSIWREYSFLPSIYILSTIGLVQFSVLISKIIIFIKKNLVDLIIIFFLIIYFLSFVKFFSFYKNSHFTKEPDIYETYCKKTADYINKNISKDSLILLPDEMGQSLISILIWNDYKYEGYNSYDDIYSYSKKSEKISIVRINESIFTSYFNRNTSFANFENYLRKINPALKIHYLEGQNQFYSVIYEL